MKYTPEEMYQYCADNGLIFWLHTALIFNDDFRHIVIDCTYDSRDGKIFALIHNPNSTDGQDPEFDMEELGFDIPISALEQPVHTKCLLCSYGDDDGNLILPRITEDMDKVWEELFEGLLKDFLECTKADTVDRLKSLVRQGLESSGQWEDENDNLADQAPEGPEQRQTSVNNSQFMEWIEAFFTMKARAGEWMAEPEAYRFAGLEYEAGEQVWLVMADQEMDWKKEEGKYTPDEMFRYCADNGLLQDLCTAFYCTPDFSHRVMSCSLSEEQGRFSLHVDKCTSKYDGILNFGIPALPPGFPKETAAVQVKYGDACVFILGEDKNTDAWKSVWKRAFLIFLDCMQADTPDRLEEVIHEGLEVEKEYEKMVEQEHFSQEDCPEEELLAEALRAQNQMLREAGNTGVPQGQGEEKY